MTLAKWTELYFVGFLQRVLGLGRSTKFVLALGMDIILCVIAVWIAFSLRLGEWDLVNRPVGLVVLASLSIWLPVALIQGIYRSIVRFTGTNTIMGIVKACMFLGVTQSVVFIVAPTVGIPRTIGAIHAIVFMMLLVVSRLIARYVLFDLPNQRGFEGRIKRVLIYGAGSAGRQLAVSLKLDPGMLLLGYVDDDDRLFGQRLDGVRIYRSDTLAELITELDVDTVLLALPRISRQDRESIVRKFSGLSVHVMTLPAVGELVDGRVTVADMREIEVEDLLGRDPVPPNSLLLHRTITGKSVLITGAGGSIGSEICRQIGKLNPATIILVEMTEHALYSIEAELVEARNAGDIEPTVAIYAELGNIADAGTAQRLFRRWQPETVFHAAAYKHVPLVEENAIAGMRNNIFGTLNCALEAERSGVSHFILVSTDKAVRPTNVMGATKRVCELILQAIAHRGTETKFAMVRFGNVLGSSGSVVPRFQQQIRQGGPVTLTHRNVTRYFMTIPEAAQLVIQAGAMAEGGEVYVLDMGQPVRIYDLACLMISLSGLSLRDESNPDGDIEIREIGLRRGEKLYEELLIGNSPRETKHPRILHARETFMEWSELEQRLVALDRILQNGDRKAALESLSSLVPELTSGCQQRQISA